MGTSWLTEMREEMKFALLCYGSSKVRTNVRKKEKKGFFPFNKKLEI